MTPAQHAARAHMFHETAARLWGSIGYGLSPERIGRKTRAAMRLQQWTGDQRERRIEQCRVYIHRSLAAGMDAGRQAARHAPQDLP